MSGSKQSGKRPADPALYLNLKVKGQVKSLWLVFLLPFFYWEGICGLDYFLRLYQSLVRLF